MQGTAGAVSERMLNLIVGGGLLTLLAYGFVSWKAGGDGFPADMRRSTLEIQERGVLLAGTLSSGSRLDAPGERAVELLGRRLGAEVRWLELPAADLLRKLEADSLDVVARYDASLPGAEAFGLTRPYTEIADSRLVLAVPAGENRLLRLADAALREVLSTGWSSRARREAGGPARQETGDRSSQESGGGRHRQDSPAPPGRQ